MPHESANVDCVTNKNNMKSECSRSAIQNTVVSFSAMATLKRVTKEYNDIMSDPPEGISAGPRPGDDILPEWDAFIHGPVNTPYEGGIFHLSIKFPGNYPFKPPKVKFETRVLHCNIDRWGCVNLDILHSQWSPALTVKKVLMSIRCLLEDPNPDDPLVPDLGSLLKKDPEEYNQQVREATLKYATPQTNSNLGNAVDSTISDHLEKTK